MFNRKECINRLQPHVDGLVEQIRKWGISFFPEDGDLQNVIFRSKNKELSVAHNLFYRFSGISCIHRDKGSEIEMVYVTDEMFYNEYMKALISFHFNEK